MRIFIAVVISATVATSIGCSAASAPKGSPGWTGLTEPEKIIQAREGLMTEMERVMRPLDSYTAGEPADPEDLRSIGQTVSQMLLAVPHLFPPTTNLYEQDAENLKTLALPPIWEHFADFEKLAEAAQVQADMITKMQTPDELKAGALALRAGCDACHAAYLRPAVSMKVTPEDLDFDLDSLFKK